MARASTDFNAKPQVVLRHLQEPNPPVLHATSHSGGTTFPRKQRSHRFQLSLQFKNKMFLKASLVRQICQSLAAKRFTSKLKSWMLKRCMPALDRRIEKPRASAAEPHVHASNRQSPLFFTPFHALSPASLGCGEAACALPRNSTETTLMPLLRPHRITPGTETALTPTSHLQPPGTRAPAAPRNTPRHEKPPARVPIRPSCPGRPQRRCVSHPVSGSLVSAAQSCLWAYRQKHR